MIYEPPRRRLWSRWASAARAALTVGTVGGRCAHSRHAPRHYDFLETAAMKRAMERL